MEEIKPCELHSLVSWTVSVFNRVHTRVCEDKAAASYRARRALRVRRYVSHFTILPSRPHAATSYRARRPPRPLPLYLPNVDLPVAANAACERHDPPHDRHGRSTNVAHALSPSQARPSLLHLRTAGLLLACLCLCSFPPLSLAPLILGPRHAPCSEAGIASTDSGSNARHVIMGQPPKSSPCAAGTWLLLPWSASHTPP